jgi:catechol 2,3-dioxygenase-like lactoylglutathione lyase family enzyme
VFDHVTIRVSDRAASKRFYDLVFDAIEFEGDTFVGEDGVEWDDFAFYVADGDHAVTRNLHVAFVGRTRELVDAFWLSLTDAGYRDDGAPGIRPQYSPDYYGAFVLDPDGNSVEAVHLGPSRTDGGAIHHLWLRVGDVAASKRFYSTIAPVLDFELARDEPDAVGFRGSGASCSFVSGDRLTENVHLAFPAPDNATVDEFHRLALEAGSRDNGPPGERLVYHQGYYGAFVLDPDGNNVEAVCHNRGP